MIEPLAHVVKGSVSRYTVLRTATGNTRLRSSLNWKKNFFTPIPRPSWMKNASPASASGKFTSVELAAQCRAWSLHSIWCPNGTEDWDFDFVPRRRDRRARSRHSRIDGSDFLSHSPPNTIHSILSLFGQRNHASMPLREEYTEAPTLPIPSASTSTVQSPPAVPSFTPSGVTTFLKYAGDEQLVRSHPEDAYKAGNTLVRACLVDRVSDRDLLSFSQGMIRVVIRHWARDRDTPRQEWITLAESLLSKVGSEPQWKKVLEAQCRALAGDIGPAESILRYREKLEALDERSVIELYNALLVSFARKSPPGKLWEYLRRGLHHLPPIRLSDQGAAPALRVLSEITLHYAARTQHASPPIHPAVSMVAGLLFRAAAHKEDVPQAWLEETVMALRRRQEDLEGNEIWSLHGPDSKNFQDFKENRRRTSPRTQRQLRNKLTEELLALSPSKNAFWYSSKLFVASVSGNREAAEEHFDKLCELTTPDFRDVEALLMAYAGAGDIKGLTRVFDELFPDPSTWSQTLTVEHFTPAFQAIARSPRPDHKALQDWRQRLEHAGLRPHSREYGQIVQYYAKHNMAKGVVSVFEEIQEKGIHVNKVVYQNGMTFFARRGDPLTVESLFRRAVDNDIKPDLHFLATLMNAHLEAGSWEGLLKAHKFVQANIAPGTNSVVIFNVLLKASHLLGHPFEMLRQSYNSLKEAGQVPDAHTYSILAQAAIDHGYTHQASVIYREMLKRQAAEPGFLTPHIYTILIGGELRAGHITKTRFYYNEMKKHGLKPNSVTFSKLLAGINRLPARKRQQLEDVSEEMRETISRGDDWKVPSFGRTDWYEHIYLQTMAAALNSDTPGQVQAVYEEIVALGYEPTLSMKTTLLESYSRRQAYDSAVELWPEVFDEAVRIKEAGAKLQTPETRDAAHLVHSDTLSPTFSLYIDAISRLGRHKEIVTAVDEYRRHGFKLSEDNWNHLILAFMRSGKPDTAFQIVEEIFLPSSGYADVNVGTQRQVWSPLYSSGARYHKPLHMYRYMTAPLRNSRLRRAAQQKPETKGWSLSGAVKEVLLKARLQLIGGFNITRTLPGTTENPAVGNYYPAKCRVRIAAIRAKSPHAWTHIRLFGVQEMKRLHSRSLSVYKESWSDRYRLWRRHRRKLRKRERMARRELKLMSMRPRTGEREAPTPEPHQDDTR